MSTIVGEDVQPNEARLSRRGEGVPLVRNIGGNMTSSGVRGRGRSHSGNTQRSMKQWHSMSRQRPTAQSSMKGSRPTVSGDSSSALHTSPTRVHDRPRKRRKLEGEIDLSHLSNVDKSAPSPSSGSILNSNKDAAKKYVDFVVHLPHSCRKGAPNNNRFRHDYIQKHKKRLEQEYGSRISRHTVGDENIIFTFLQKPPEQPSVVDPEGADIVSGSSTLPDHASPEPGCLPLETDDASQNVDPCPEVHEAVLDLTHSDDDGGANENNAPSQDSIFEPDAHRSIDVEIIDLTDDLDGTEGSSSEMKQMDEECPEASFSNKQDSCVHGPDDPYPQAFLSAKFISTTVRIQPSPSTSDGYLAVCFDLDVPLRDPSNDRRPQSVDPDATAQPSSSFQYSVGCGRFSTSRRLVQRTEGDIVNLPRHQYDKPRRLLFSPTSSFSSPLSYVVTMHGFIRTVSTLLPRSSICLRSLNHPEEEYVDDACLFGMEDRTMMLLAHARERTEISLLDITSDKVIESITLSRPLQVRSIKDPSKTTGTGISAVCPLRQPGRFASGGYDHLVHLWSLCDEHSLTASTPTLLSIKHTSLVQSLLAIRDTSHKLVSAGADRAVHLWDLSSERVVRTLSLSNSVYHVHELENPFCTLLEIGHREQQFEIRDHRLVPEKPVQRFGYVSVHTHGRYMKGDVRSSTFACGDREGAIRLWDLRNTRATALSMSCFPGRKVVQVVFNGVDGLTACSEDSEITTLIPGLGLS